MSLRVPALVCLAAVIPVLGYAQVPVRGTVLSEGDRAVVGAEVKVEALGLTLLTDANGGFELSAPAGVLTLVVRAVGYEPAILTLVASADRANDFVIDLTPRPQILDSVTTTAEAPLPRGRMRAFEERRRVGMGRFLTREELAERENSRLSDVLRTTGIPLMRRPTPCGGGFAVASGRGSGTIVKLPRCGGRPMPTACYMAVYLDGVRIWALGQQDPTNIDSFSPRELEGVEIYRGSARAPAQYSGLDHACGVILLWTRES